MPLSQRPQLVLSYLPEVDQNGHAHGPNSGDVDDALELVDQFVEGLWGLVVERNLTGVVDVVVVSDHGMTETSDVRLVFLDELLGEDLYAKVEHKEGWPSAGLRFREDAGVDEAQVVEMLKAKAKEVGGFQVYTHETMPERYHFVRPLLLPLLPPANPQLTSGCGKKTVK